MRQIIVFLLSIQLLFVKGEISMQRYGERHRQWTANSTWTIYQQQRSLRCWLLLLSTIYRISRDSYERITLSRWFGFVACVLTLIWHICCSVQWLKGDDDILHVQIKSIFMNRVNTLNFLSLSLLDCINSLINLDTDFNHSNPQTNKLDFSFKDKNHQKSISKGIFALKISWINRCFARWLAKR